MKAKPQIFKAIGTALLGTVAFTLAYLVTYILIGLIIYFLNAIPIVRTLLGWFFEMRGDSPSILLAILSPTIGYVATELLLSAINKNNSTLGLSLIIVGSLLIPLHLISMVINLICGSAILANIAQIVAGIALIVKGTDTIRKG